MPPALVTGTIVALLAVAPATAQMRAIPTPAPVIVVPPPTATPRPTPPPVVVAPRPTPPPVVVPKVVAPPPVSVPQVVVPRVTPPPVAVPRPATPRVVLPPPVAVPRITPSRVLPRVAPPRIAVPRIVPPRRIDPDPAAPRTPPPSSRTGVVTAPVTPVAVDAGQRRLVPPPPLPPVRFGALSSPELLEGGAYDPDEIEARTIVVALAPGLGAAAGAQMASDNALVVLESADVPLIGAFVMRLRVDDGRTLDEAIAGLSADVRVAYAGPNRIYRPQAGAGAQYALDKLGLVAAPGAAPAATGRGVSIAVIDTAPDLAHPELAQAGVRLASVLEGASAMDHGTQIVGLVAAAGVLRGAAPDADVLAIAAFGPVGDDGLPASATYRLLRALDVAQREGAAVVNMSFAGGADDLLAQGLDAMARDGAVLVAAAGNNGPGAAPAFPGSHPAVIAVTATDMGDGLYARANRGDYVVLSAPGVDVLAPAAGDRYALGSGTSLAAAYVSAIAALVLERSPGAGADAVRAALAGSARDLGPSGRDPLFGHGLAAPRAAAERLASAR